MDTENNKITDNNVILATNVLIDYLLPNWFHTIRQPLTIISTASGFLQILSGTESFDEHIFNDKLQMIQNNSRQVELLMNDLKFFLAGNQVATEKISVHIKKIFDLLGRDLLCWNVTADLQIEGDFHTANSVSISLITAAVYKAFGTAINGSKTAILHISSTCKPDNSKKHTTAALKEIFSTQNDEKLHSAVETLLTSCPDINFDLNFSNNALNLSISERTGF